MTLLKSTVTPTAIIDCLLFRDLASQSHKSGNCCRIKIRNLIIFEHIEWQHEAVTYEPRYEISNNLTF